MVVATSGAALGRWRSSALLAAVLCLGLPALLGPPNALLPAVSAVVAVSVPLLRWPWGRITESTAALVVMAVSSSWTSGTSASRA